MAKTTRVHILAKELGVKSKAIVEKCQAEDLDVKNHMSTISAGLAATIREWFSEGEHTTTVETAKRVDLEKVRVKKKSRTAEEEPGEEESREQEAIEAVEPETEEAAEPRETQETAEPEPVTEAAEVETAEPAEEEQEETEVEKPEETEEETPQKPVIHKPKKPEQVVPAGPMLEKPKPAKLSGPTVIRVESVEPDSKRPRRPRSPRAQSSRYDAPISEPLMQTSPDAGIVSDKKAKKKDKTRGRRKDVDESLELKKKNATKKMRQRDIEDRRARLAAARGESFRSRPSRRIETGKKMQESMPVERPEKATITEPITVKDLSNAIAAKSSEIIKKLLEQGVLATANQAISTEVAELIALEMGTELIVERKESLQQQIEKEYDSLERKNLKKRPPIVTMLGHVDHGKTSLLDRIRKTDVATGEAGGITQHIGAYQVDCKGHIVTFLDTPGHEAFTEMRARGANMTDIVVLVVAADDGLMPQTIEAIHHARAAGVEILVALNKIDLPGVDINRIYGQLAEHDLTPTEWSGTTEVVKTSAVTGEGIENLLEYMDYIAELKDYQSDPTVPASGWVVEAKMTTTHGAVATILVKEGTLKKGDIILAGESYGRIRTMKNWYGKGIKSAGCSMPVEVSGLNGVPQAGDKFLAVSDINTAKNAAEENMSRNREETLAKRSQVTLDNLFSQIEAGKIKELNVILKADVQGSVDVLNKHLTELNTDEVQIKIIHSAVGGVTEGDVVLAEASGAIIIGFNAVADEKVKEIADSKGVDIRFYNIIYRITEDLRDAMSGMLEPELSEKHLGQISVRQTFKVSNLGTIAGCYVSSGIVTKKSFLRLIRNGIVVKDKCSIDSLKHFKDDAREVKAGLECGIKLAGYDDIKVDDVFEAYEIVEIARKL